MADILDQAAIANLLDMASGDAGFVDELVDAFLSDVPRELDTVRSALASGDAAAIVRPAHTIKGMSLNIGAGRVTEAARRLEEDARAGSLGSGPEVLAALEEALNEVGLALAEARQRRWAPA